MNKTRLTISNRRGMTLVELIMTITVLGILIAPVTSMFVFSAKINSAAGKEFEAGMLAQSYMEEIKAMEELDKQKYVYNSWTGKYERCVPETESNYGAEISIEKGEGIVYLIDISIINDGEVVKVFEGSNIFGE
ncbi:MAG: prepilin-type N-terminal cleavage/methylation domain-containing protein [Sedimentibacter saalensis]|uniref:type IV pilus modification PilV family protein n=1 Tax=Sedimentibacter saalensis TaxID=130788 RepID=UPI002B207186|nr:prepilin-type N-terminal cleavage/methylation domain-containing protein [Sedimentibacter saalensis]MEA5095461.1 prepilin-type N-terminal cleavage/methylation domain-containing protein [Sedimentibacter saalensis]